MWKSNFEEIRFEMFTERDNTFTRFQCGWEFIPKLMMGAATEKARLPKFSLVLGIESCCEVDDLSCLDMLENAVD